MWGRQLTCSRSCWCRFGVEVEGGIRMGAKTGRGVRGRNWCVQRPLHRMSFTASGYDTEKPVRRQNTGKSQGNRACRDVLHGRKQSIVDLLVPTGGGQLHDLHIERVVEIRDWRIVKCQVAVLADTHAHNV